MEMFSHSQAAFPMQPCRYMQPVGPPPDTNLSMTGSRAAVPIAFIHARGLNQHIRRLSNLFCAILEGRDVQEDVGCGKVLRRARVMAAKTHSCA
eukprot:2342078-Rhodomonas_salina.4